MSRSSGERSGTVGAMNGIPRGSYPTHERPEVSGSVEVREIPSMTTEQRQAVRAEVTAEGRHRVGFTGDAGDGEYEEWWKRDSDDSLVVIEWAPKLRPAREQSDV